MLLYRPRSNGFSVVPLDGCAVLADPETEVLDLRRSLECEPVLHEKVDIAQRA